MVTFTRIPYAKAARRARHQDHIVYVILAAVIMSILLSAGMPESPMPGKSGAITVNFLASNGMIGRHIRDVCV